MSKERIRKVFLRKRKLLSEKEYQYRNAKIASSFLQTLNPSEPATVHVFLPILKNREVNTWLIVKELAKSNKHKVVVSRSSLETNTMAHYYYTSEIDIKENEWGIPEPNNGLLADTQDIDIVLVPLLAFDINGMRVGYGKGYYDKFLSECRPNVKKVGLSLIPPIDQISEIYEHDIPLDNCITHLGEYHFVR